MRNANLQGLFIAAKPHERGFEALAPGFPLAGYSDHSLQAAARVLASQLLETPAGEIEVQPAHVEHDGWTWYRAKVST